MGKFLDFADGFSYHSATIVRWQKGELSMDLFWSLVRIVGYVNFVLGMALGWSRVFTNSLESKERNRVMVQMLMSIFFMIAGFILIYISRS